MPGQEVGCAAPPDDEVGCAAPLVELCAAGCAMCVFGPPPSRIHFTRIETRHRRRHHSVSAVQKILMSLVYRRVSIPLFARSIIALVLPMYIPIRTLWLGHGHDWLFINQPLEGVQRCGPLVYRIGARADFVAPYPYGRYLPTPPMVDPYRGTHIGVYVT